MSFSFGEVRYIDPYIGGIALISTIAFLATCEYTSISLEHTLQHSPVYMSMLQKIYRELMIMGIVSFSLVMYEASTPNSSDIVHHWISIFDYIGYILFFNAIFFVIHAFTIIVWSIRTSIEYGKFHDSRLADITLAIEDLKKNYFIRKLYESNYNPFLPIPRQMAEFKVIHVLFRDTFGIPTDFAFSDYLGKCFERYSLNIIHLSMTSWIVMIILYGANLIRIFSPNINGSFRCIEEEGNSHNDDDNQNDHDNNHDNNNNNNNSNNGNDNYQNMNHHYQSTSFHHHYLRHSLNFNHFNNNQFNDNDSDNNHNTISDLNLITFTSITSTSSDTSTSHSSLLDCNKLSVQYFSVCAILLLLYVFLIFFLGRVYTLRLLHKKGVEGIHGLDDDLSFFLAQEATRELNNKEEEGGDCIGINSNDNGINSVLNSQSFDDIILLHRGNIRSESRRMSLKTFSKSIEKVKSGKHQKKNKKNKTKNLFERTSENLSSISENDKLQQPISDNHEEFDIRTIPAIAEKVAKVKERKRVQEEAMFKLKSKQIKDDILDQNNNNNKDNNNNNNQKENKNDNYLKLEEDFSDIYTFQSPTLYFRAVEIGIVLNCLYLSLWVSDFIHIANQLEHSSLYQIIMALPLILLVPLLTQTVKTASMLAAIAALDVEVIGEVLEDTQERITLIQELRDKITRRTKGSGLGQQELLEAVFREIDTDGSGEINKKEFQALLVKMEMCYSGKKFRSLYNAIDRNNDGSLSIDELNHILFPKAAQEKEVQAIVEKVQTHLEQQLSNLENVQTAVESSNTNNNVTLKEHTKRLKKISSLKSLKSLTLAAQVAKSFSEIPAPNSDNDNNNNNNNNENENENNNVNEINQPNESNLENNNYNNNDNNDIENNINNQITLEKKEITFNSTSKPKLLDISVSTLRSNRLKDSQKTLKDMDSNLPQNIIISSPSSPPPSSSSSSPPLISIPVSMDNNTLIPSSILTTNTFTTTTTNTSTTTIPSPQLISENLNSIPNTPLSNNISISPRHSLNTITLPIKLPSMNSKISPVLTSRNIKNDLQKISEKENPQFCESITQKVNTNEIQKSSFSSSLFNMNSETKSLQVEYNRPDQSYKPQPHDEEQFTVRADRSLSLQHNSKNTHPVSTSTSTSTSLSQSKNIYFRRSLTSYDYDNRDKNLSWSRNENENQISNNFQTQYNSELNSHSNFSNSYVFNQSNSNISVHQRPKSASETPSIFTSQSQQLMDRVRKHLKESNSSHRIEPMDHSIKLDSDNDDGNILTFSILRKKRGEEQNGANLPRHDQKSDVYYDPSHNV